MATRKKKDEERVEAAVKQLETVKSLRVVGNRFDIAKSTLHDHATGKCSRVGAGRPTVLSSEEEKAIVRSCQELAQNGFPLDRMTVGTVVSAYLKEQGRQNPFKDGVPGKKWWQGFLQRWPSLSERKPQHFQAARARSSTPEVMDKYFQNVKALLERHGFDKMSPSEQGRRIWNCDETGLCTAVASHKVLAKRGDRTVHETGGGSGREYITILCCGSAIGEKLPPYILYKGKYHQKRHMVGGPPGTLYSRSDSGWMESANFLEWFSKLFLPAVEEMLRTGPVVLFLDGHHSHETLALIEQAKQNGVTIFAFPPHTTHLLQPLDVGVFGPLKKVWSQVLKTYKLETMGARVDKEQFPSLVSKMWPQVLLPEHIIGGFRGAGLHPLSRSAIPSSKTKTSAPFQVTSQPQQSSQSAQQTSQSAQQSPQSVQQSSQSAQQSSQSAQQSSQSAQQSSQSAQQSYQSAQQSSQSAQQSSPLRQPQQASAATPVSIHIAKFFGNIFIQNSRVAIQHRGESERIQPSHYGEALTEEEVCIRLQQQEDAKKERARQMAEKKKERERIQQERQEARIRKQAEKEERVRQQEQRKEERAAQRKEERAQQQAQRKEERAQQQAQRKEERAQQQAQRKEERARQKGAAKEKKGRKGRQQRRQEQSENICQGCSGHFDDDCEEFKEGWIGCDERGCWRWYHYWCAGLLDVPDPKLKWICPACKEE